MTKLKNLVELNKLLKHHDGYTVYDLSDSLKVEVRAVRDYLTELKNTYNATFVENLYKGNKRLWRYKDLNFSVDFVTYKDKLKKQLDKEVKRLSKGNYGPQYEWLKACFLAFEEGKLKEMYGVVMFDNNPYLKGLEFLPELIEAIRKKYPLRVTYNPFDKDERTEKVHPYMLRQYNSRWFLLGGRDEDGVIRTYAIDRIEKIEILNKKFKPCPVDFDEYFDDVIGVTVMQDEKAHPVETIKLMVDRKRYNYIETKPLHGSQKHVKTEDTPDRVCITIEVQPNPEFYSEMLSFGPDVEIVSPLSVRAELQRRVADMVARYAVPAVGGKVV